VMWVTRRWSGWGGSGVSYEIRAPFPSRIGMAMRSCARGFVGVRFRESGPIDEERAGRFSKVVILRIVGATQ
jgi:hypothetical protein